MRMFCAALSRDGSLGSLSPDHSLGISPPSKLDKLRCEGIFVFVSNQSFKLCVNLSSRCAGYSAEFLDRVTKDTGVGDHRGPGTLHLLSTSHGQGQITTLLTSY